MNTPSKKRHYGAIAASLFFIAACASEPDPAPQAVGNPAPEAPTNAPTETPMDAAANTSNQGSLHTDPEPSIFQPTLSICPLANVSNPPTPRDGLRIESYRPFVPINGVQVAVAPVAKACFSSGFGPRNGRTHKGIDLHNASAVDVFAAGTGTVREKHYRDDYGNMIVLDHGDGVFTRYAHLDSFADGLETGDRVAVGDVIGVMGNTASYRIPRHLHYEVLTGEWGARAGSFALDPVDLFAALSDN